MTKVSVTGKQQQQTLRTSCVSLMVFPLLTNIQKQVSYWFLAWPVTKKKRKLLEAPRDKLTETSINNFWGQRVSYSPVVSTRDKLEEPLALHKLQLLRWKKEHILAFYGERTLSILLRMLLQRRKLPTTKSYCILN